MTFPIINDYKTAIRNAGSRLASLDVIPQVDASGNPVFVAGNFAGVFKVTGSDGNPIAVKCFIRDLPDLERRQTTLARFIGQTPASYLVDMAFLPNEIFVKSAVAPDRDYPVVAMPWVEGRTMGSVVEMFCGKDNRRGLAALSRAWAILCLDMMGRGIAHGDIKHDNILVTREGQLKLIDYDSMYLPALRGLASTLLGGVNYQHPMRAARHFDQRIDHFSILVVTLSLRALTLQPGLHRIYHTGENIILGRTDFVAPDRSEVLGLLSESPDYFVRDWADRLITACLSRSIEIPGLKRILQRAAAADQNIEKGGFWKFIFR